MVLPAPLHTPSLRLEPITARLATLAAHGSHALQRALDVDVSEDWRGAHVWPRGPIIADAAPRHALIIHRRDLRIIGDVRFDRARGERPTFEIGYGIAPRYRRRGYATEAAGALVDALFSIGAAEVIIAGCRMDNFASIRTLRRLGFELDGASTRGHAFWWRIEREA